MAKLRESALTAIVDSREKAEWNLEQFGFRIERATLPFADYSIKGLENLIAIERKGGSGSGLSDLTHSITRTRKQMDKRILALRSYRYSYLIISGSGTDIVNHNYRSQISPNSILGTIARYQFQGISVLNADNEDMAAYICARLLYFAAAEVYRYSQLVVSGIHFPDDPEPAETPQQWPEIEMIDPPLPEPRKQRKEALR